MISAYSMARPLLFKLPPEKSHHLAFATLEMLQNLNVLKHLCPPVVKDPVTVMGIEFPNRVGLAAGLDKNAEYIHELGFLGFGFLEIGTVTPKPQSGNTMPRLFRLPKANALINRMGFNNLGLERVLENVKESAFSGVLGINIGKNAATAFEHAIQDYLTAFEAVYPYASYITINVSSPNTKNLRDLQEKNSLDNFLQLLKNKQIQLADEHGLYKPIVLKIAPDLNNEQIDVIAQRLIHFKFDGVIATNTTIDKTSVAQLPFGNEEGGLSGEPVRDKSTEVIRKLYAQLGDDIPIIGVGGIFNGVDAVEKIRAGAKLVQIYTGLIYQGPSLISECAATIEYNCKHFRRLKV